MKNAMVGISREIWCSNRETGRFDEKLGDSRENRVSWQVRPIMNKAEAHYLHVYASEYGHNRYFLSNYLHVLTGCNIRS